MSQDQLAPDVQTVVDQVRMRTRWQNAISGTAVGLVVGCGIAVTLAIASAFATPIAVAWLPTAVVTAAVLGGLGGLLRPVTPAAAAQRIDSHYRMKDRVITALQFSADGGSQRDDRRDPLRQLQVDEARQQLRQVRSQDCVPMRSHRSALVSSVGLAAAAVVILLVGESRRSESAAVVPLNLAVEQASLLRQTLLPELEALKDQAADQPELAALTEQLAEIVDQMENESIDERDLMAKLSEMEQAIAQARDAMQLELTDAQLKSVAEAFESSEAMKRAAAAMQQEKYDEASEQLEAIDPAALSDRERRAVSQDLKKFLSKLPAGQQGKLSEAVGEIQEGLENQNNSQCKEGLCKLAGLCKSQGNCKSIGQCMASQLNRLAQCKGQCRGGNKNGGSSVAKTDSPSNGWGTGASGQPNGGQETNLDSRRQEEQLAGTQGDGPSETEVIEAPEGEQTAARAYAQRYQQFRSQAEAVLDNEPLPLGHRETVRQYFERIRPDNATLEEL